MTISDADKARLRRKIADKNSLAFTDPEIQDIWDEADGSMLRAQLICWEELMADAAKFTAYTQNQTSEQKNQIFDHIAEVLVPYFQTKVARSKSSVRILGIKVRPPRRTERPYTDPRFTGYYPDQLGYSQNASVLGPFFGDSDFE